MNPKEKTAELCGRLRDAARMQDPIAMAAVELVKLTLDDAKERLVEEAGDDMLRRQGAAQELRRLLRELTIVPPSIKPGAS